MNENDFESGKKPKTVWDGYDSKGIQGITAHKSGLTRAEAERRYEGLVGARIAVLQNMKNCQSEWHKWSQAGPKKPVVCSVCGALISWDAISDSIGRQQAESEKDMMRKAVGNVVSFAEGAEREGVPLTANVLNDFSKALSIMLPGFDLGMVLDEYGIDSNTTFYKAVVNKDFSNSPKISRSTLQASKTISRAVNKVASLEKLVTKLKMGMVGLGTSKVDTEKKAEIKAELTLAEKALADERLRLKSSTD